MFLVCVLKLYDLFHICSTERIDSIELPHIHYIMGSQFVLCRSNAVTLFHRPERKTLQYARNKHYVMKQCSVVNDFVYKP